MLALLLSLQSYDSLGEKVDLVGQISGDTPEVEDWLNEFEEEMKRTLKENIIQALETFNQKSKKAMVF